MVHVVVADWLMVIDQKSVWDSNPVNSVSLLSKIKELEIHDMLTVRSSLESVKACLVHNLNSSVLES